MNVTLSPPQKKGGSETLIRCFTSETDIDETLLQGFFMLKNLSAYIILPLMPP